MTVKYTYIFIQSKRVHLAKLKSFSFVHDSQGHELGIRGRYHRIQKGAQVTSYVCVSVFCVGCKTQNQNSLKTERGKQGYSNKLPKLVFNCFSHKFDPVSAPYVSLKNLVNYGPIQPKAARQGITQNFEQYRCVHICLTVPCTLWVDPAHSCPARYHCLSWYIKPHVLVISPQNFCREG